ncbi:ROK family protein [Streptomyces griseomycini]|uniref:Glucokinase n=1 Tax=Streptomyces griseomycini TaxID=66895 RepID=A0A7W7V9N9_9ACTN|nr:ROK family protein [Streptomyces griseomycini]MBB4902146.1 glucokinase [Streptomyces griseomycini]GGR37440.1 transcriptional regulator [Streptomyces griseomycini]
MTARHPHAPVIGLDLGGTKIAAALVAGDGAVLARHRLPTPATEGAEAVLDALAEAARAVRAPGTTAIGVAAAGVIDPATGTVTSATGTLRGWAGTALAAGLADRTGLPVACDNDVRAAAATELSELSDPRGGGAGPGSAVPAAGGARDGGAAHDGGADRDGGLTLIYAAVGTGVGGAVAAAGRVLHGTAGIAGHLGHLPSPEADGLPCTCGATGHLEAIAAGPGITAHYTRTSGVPADRLETVAARAAEGDPHATAAIVLGAEAVGRTLGGLANTLGADRVVVGGGVPRIGALYTDALEAAFAAELMPPLRKLRPVPPRGGADAAVLGAAALPRTLPLHHPHTTGAPR